MSLTITAGAGSLISLGMSIADVANLYALGRRVGNWVTAVSGDTELLNLLQSDEMDILCRRGMIDLPRFNKRWGQRARLLLNGRPAELVGDDAARVLGVLSRFTATMVSVVAALDGFMSYPVLKSVMKRLFKELLRTTEFGEEVLASQLNDRINAWRSTAYIRGLSIEAQSLRKALISSKQVLEGYIVPGEESEIVEFLFWLLAGTTNSFRTASSDAFGIAITLSRLAFDMLHIDGEGQAISRSGVKVVYDPELIGSARDGRVSKEELVPPWREAVTVVPLMQPEEGLSSYPIDRSAASEARQAWVEGRKAARSVRLRLKKVALGHRTAPLTYEAINTGSPSGRVRSEIYALAKHWALCVNAEFCRALEMIFERASSPTMDWLLEQDSPDLPDSIVDDDMLDEARIMAFTMLQSFVLGYYYAVLMPLIDVSTLAFPCVDGAWGFRNIDALITIRECAISNPLTREGMLMILSCLFVGRNVDMPDVPTRNSCVGVIGKRALLINSLVAASDSTDSIGGFTLLDVDIGGIPCTHAGFVLPGEAEPYLAELDKTSAIPRTIIPASPDVEFTKHIEPDWESDPSRSLIVMRYRGRRVIEINPSIMDREVCCAYIDPVDEPAIIQEIPNAIELTIQNLLCNRVPRATADRPLKLVLQSKGMPGLRYAAIAVFSTTMNNVVSTAPFDAPLSLASNCVVAADNAHEGNIIIM